MTTLLAASSLKAALQQPPFQALFQRFLDNQCSPEEAAQVLDLLATGQLTEEQEELLRQHVTDWSGEYEEDPVLDNKLQQVHAKIHASILAGEQPRKGIRIMRRAAAAAAAILLLAGSTYLLLNNNNKTLPAIADVKQPDVPPGGNRAMLTLANGTTVLLDSASNGPLPAQGGTNLTKVQHGVLAYSNSGKSASEGTNYNTLTTPRGGQYRVTLPDGTHVWLNAASSLKYPIRFYGPERIVTLTGEAYFEVAANAHIPFKVITNNQVIQVLGTHFNVMAYDDEQSIQTTLVEGAVKVIHGNNSKLMKPGQQATLLKSASSLQLGIADVEQALAWKNGYFQFEGADLPTLMRQIARWYDLQVVFEGKITDHEFVGKISRSAHLSSVLKALQLSDIHFSIDGNKLIVKP